VTHLALLRGINVGKRTLRTAEFAASLGDLSAANVGAAGTFAVSGAPSERHLRGEIVRRIPFPTEAVLVPRSELQGLLRSPPYDGSAPVPGSRRSITFLAAPARSIPLFPFEQPPQGPWEVRLLSYRHPFVAGEHVRRRPDRIVYPNEIVEKEFGVPATTRWWETVLAVEAAFRPREEPGFVANGIGCMKNGLTYAIPAAFLFWLLVRRGAILYPKLIGAAIGGLGGLIGLTVLEINCPNLNVFHILVWHWGVVFLSSAAGALLGAAAEYVERLRSQRPC